MSEPPQARAAEHANGGCVLRLANAIYDVVYKADLWESSSSDASRAAVNSPDCDLAQSDTLPGTRDLDMGLIYKICHIYAFCDSIYIERDEPHSDVHTAIHDTENRKMGTHKPGCPGSGILIQSSPEFHPVLAGPFISHRHWMY